MPAMSPTMTEGNIASWKVKEGDSFSTGDVLLEIETDKAQMDVEAQDGGMMAKITQPNGSKGVKVGSRIAVIAESDDDLGSLSLPAEDTASASPQEDTKSGVDPSQSSESQAEAPPSSKEGTDTAQPSGSEAKPSSSSGKPTKQKYPLYPSVAGLLHEKGIPSSEVDKIPASGPKGRLLKGDVLAYLGRISESYPSEQSTRITKLSHLDLSKIQVAARKEVPPPSSAPESEKAREASAPAPEPKPEPESDTEVAVTISFKSLLEVQKRIQDTLGVTMPLSTFIARATEVANDDLPRPTNSKPSSDELFNQVLGLDKVHSTKSTSRGTFTPQVTALPPSMAFPRAPLQSPKRQDIIDILTGHPAKTASSRIGLPPRDILAKSETGSTSNVFSISVAKGEEKRARIFLERIKTTLQVEPGRLVM
ncbi:MAG: hypothetical protein Q9218_000453 [Villophora microphyllina]